MTFYRNAVVVFSLAFIGLGVALLVRTAAEGGGIGFLIGAMFVALGAGRLALARRRA